MWKETRLSEIQEHAGTHSPACVGQSDGHGAQQQVTLGLTDDGFTVCSRRNHHKLTHTIPTTQQRRTSGSDGRVSGPFRHIALYAHTQVNLEKHLSEQY